MKILALDTSTRAGSVALLEGEQLVSSYALDVTATHSERLLPAVDRCLTDAGWRLADVELIACAKGPGSFTGLRIGLATAKGVALATGTPLVGVNSLEASALGFAFGTTPICPMIDARKRQVFAALFAPDGHGQWSRLAEDCSVNAAEYAAQIEGPCLFVGGGATLFEESIRAAKPDAVIVPPTLTYTRAAGVGWLGGKAYARGEEGLVAHYVRLSDAEMNPKFAKQEA
ncbi:MAG: tRNA (adenosine(37)-N6)-threonylcarbamoyltransferase complex dimerization subunit type 1 TsaB [Candidatus Lernaella stagnicola]|nr:tRNA (adenosine(37)-N6)-threonylcarbamoyltransferase complex dimerization subunit type 1 TsaB [Candidatus Lernaella stagnicola]